ncbi:MAG: radical SAM protein [Bacteroidales bacterium]|nr:radical SAM protein [Bacteroidales bacterium]MBN2748086.1 radical SAM protein [Bacteroidales bacterium]
MDKIKTRNYFDIKGAEVIIDPNRKYNLIIQKEYGSWATVCKSKSHIIDALFAGITLDEYKKRYEIDLDLLKLLFSQGVLRVNGQLLVKDSSLIKCCNTIKSPYLLIFKYTNQCNLRCSYCYAWNKSNCGSSSMSNDTLIYVLKKIINAYGDKEYCVCLHGGEPLLKMRNLRSVVEDIKRISDKIDITLQTNATLITDEFATFVKEQNIEVGVSVDGFDERTNCLRLDPNGNGSINESLRGIERLRSAGVKVGLLSVITEHNQRELLSIFDFYVQRGVRYFGFNQFIPAGRGSNASHIIDIDDLVETNLELIRKINSINSKLSNVKQYVVQRELSKLINNISSWNRNGLCKTLPCGAGSSVLSFDVDGSIYPCDDFISDDRFCLGNIYEIFDIKKHLVSHPVVKALQNQSLDNIKECKECLWKRICSYNCASESFFANNSFEQPSIMCLYVKRMVPEIIDMIQRGEITPDNFLQ